MKKNTILSLLTHSFLLTVLLGLSFSLNAQNPSLDWAKSMGGQGENKGWNISADDSGNVYTSGYFTQTVDFDPGTTTHNITSNGTYNGFVSKLNKNGDFAWVAHISGGYTRCWANDVDDSGNVYIIGDFTGTAQFGSTTLSVAGISSRPDIYVAKLDPQGNFLWVRQLGNSAGSNFGRGLHVDDSGYVYITGYFMYSLQLGSTTVTSPGGYVYEAFVAKMDPQGNFLWAQNMGGRSHDRGFGVSVDTLGNVYATGTFTGNAAFGSTTFNSNGGDDIYVSKLDKQGNFLWTKQIGGSGNDKTRRTITAKDGHVYITGWFQRKVDFDPGTGTNTLTTRGNDDAFVLKLDAQGNFVWVKQIGGSGDDQGYSSISVDPSGNIYTGGFFNGTCHFDTLSLTSSGQDDIYLCMLDSSGDFKWVKGMGSSGSDKCYGVTIDDNCNFYATGYFENTVDFDPDSSTSNLTSKRDEDIFVLKLSLGGVNAKNSTNAPICAGDTLKFKSEGGDTYSWTGPNGFTSTKQNPNIPNADTSASGDYIITITSKAGCFSTNTIHVEVNPSPTIKITSNSPVCVGDTITLTSSGGKSYSWTGPNGYSSTKQNPTIASADTSASGNYMVSVTDSNGCSDTASVNVIVNTVPTATASSNSPICEKDSLQLNAAGGSSYNWTGPNTYSSTKQNPTIANADLSASGDYIVTVSNNNGCGDASDTVHVIVDSPLPAPVVWCSAIENGSGVEFIWDSVPGASEYEVSLDGGNTWKKANGNDGLSDVESSKQETIMVRAVNNNGACKYGKVVQSEACISNLVIPNIFTPNGDGKNDVFKIAGLSLFPGTNVLIFDRWGRKVYENDNYQNDWDGDNLKDGSYLYIITINNKDQTVHKGNLTILNSEE